jgi:alkanesulfonate monooxygenase SsuD/methylene tetrahydromethanopterin reductase-like flavin-dependent oxidoreductase (luciferase family)
MRVAMNVPIKGPDGVRPSDAKTVALRAQWVEQAGLDGIWFGDGLPIMARPNPLMWLLIAGNATEHVELGTSVLIAPSRHPYVMAQDFLTLEALLPGRFTIGVGAGSGRAGAEAMGYEFDDRFKRLHSHMAQVREICGGASPIEFGANASNAAAPQHGGDAPQRMPAMVPWGQLVGGPRFVLGAWHSEISLRRAVREYDGWMCSAGRTNFNTMKEAIHMFRDLGGKRAMVSTCLTDLRAESKPQTDDDSFYLQCSPEEARDRLGRLDELGFDDILLVKANHEKPLALYEPDFTLEELEEIRSLLPKDDRKPY